MTTRRGNCSVCGARLGASYSVCTTCRGTKIGYPRHFFAHSCINFITYPIALLIVGGMIWAMFWVISLLQ